MMEYYPAIKRNKLMIEQLGWSQRHYVKWKKPFSKGYILYDSIFMILSKRQNCSDW